MTIEATFESRCIYCDTLILEGDPIRQEFGDGEWMHEHCADESEAEA